MEFVDLQDQFATRVTRAATAPWEEIRIHYENIAIEGKARVVYTSEYWRQGVAHDMSLSVEALYLLEKLKSAKTQTQNESWTWLEFSVDRSGKYHFEYKYSLPPLIQQQLKYEPKR